MHYVKVKDGEIVSHIQSLPSTLALDSGETLCGFNTLSDAELLTYGWYKVVEIQLNINPAYEQRGAQILTLNGDIVELTYIVEPILANENLVTQRLTTFAKEKDIDIQEVAILLNSTNTTWKQEAQTFQTLYDATWQEFYASTATTWAELESELPTLSWP